MRNEREANHHIVAWGGAMNPVDVGKLLSSGALTRYKPPGLLARFWRLVRWA